MQSIQNKIDKFIQQGNQAFSEENRVIEALTKYSRAYELYNYLDRKYKVQIHEVLVRIAICWDVLGNYVLAYENLCKALVIIPKIKVLTVYKTALEFSLNKNKEAYETLELFNKICQHSKYIYLYYLFNIIFRFIEYDNENNINHEKQLHLLEDINKYFSKYGKGTVLLYIRSNIYNNLYTWAKAKNKNELLQDYSTRREEDIKNAMSIDKIDTNCLITEGVTRSNLTKLFFMVLPEMDDYQPKVLVDYSNFFCGFQQFYTIFRFLKKVKKKKNSAFTEDKENDSNNINVNLETDTLLYYFIRNKFFAQFNLSEYFFNPFSEKKINKDISSISLSRIYIANSKINKKSLENEIKLFDNKKFNKMMSNSSNYLDSNLKSNLMHKKNLFEFTKGINSAKNSKDIIKSVKIINSDLNINIENINKTPNNKKYNSDYKEQK
jgi:hypothetical protein